MNPQKSSDTIVDQIKKETGLRVWLAIVYPESSKTNWLRILEDACVSAAVSPIHDRDVWDEEGEDALGNKHEVGDLKKPHYHLVLYFRGKKSYTQVYDLLKLLALDPDHCPPPQRPKGDKIEAVQYLIHKNHKDKAQYLRSDIVSLNGFDVDSCFMLNSEEEEYIDDCVMQFILDNNIYEYWDLRMSLRILKHKDEIYAQMDRYVRRHTILYTATLKSRRYADHQDGKFESSDADSSDPTSDTVSHFS